jgi:hypothetical protein
MPKPLPPIVKQYKHKTIHGNVPGMQNTGISLNEGDLYSILATGNIDLGGGRGYGLIPSSRLFIMRIGKNYYFSAIRTLTQRARISNTRLATGSGKLYLGIKDGRVNDYGEPLDPEWYRDNFGSFSVDIIVWKTKDYVQIADFFEKMKEKDPDNEAITVAFKQASYREKLFLASAKASKEIEETKKEIQKLKKESLQEKETIAKSVKEKKPAPRTKPTAPDLKKGNKIAQLEAKLSGLMETLKQLDEMKRQLEEERKRTTLLSKELSEKERREKDLLTRLEHAEKNPPMIVVAAPRMVLRWKWAP